VGGVKKGFKDPLIDLFDRMEEISSFAALISAFILFGY